MSFTKIELINMVYTLGESQKNPILAARLYHQQYPDAREPPIYVFEKLKRRFEESGSVEYKKRKCNNKAVTNEDNELLILLSLQENPKVSVRNLSKHIEISKSSVNRIIRQHKYHPFHISLHQELYENDFERRYQFCQTMQDKINQQNDFLSFVLFTDEATFKSNGLVNRHNMHYYATENPHWVRQVDNQNVWSLTVWGGILYDHVIGPYFFEGHVTGEKYLHFLGNELPLLLEEVPLEIRRTMWFQQDGAPAHYHREVRGHLNTIFRNRWIGRAGPIGFPPRSPGLTPMDFFLWGYVKELVYQNIPTSPENMKQRIREAFQNIPRQVLLSVQTSIRQRIRCCMQQQGGLFEHLL